MSNVIGIFPSGVSNQTMRDQLLRQLDANQVQMSQLETEISTGYQFQLPSQNTEAAMQVESIQSMLERTTQLQTNISTNQNYLSETDSTLSSVSSLLTSIQSAALSAVGSTANASERQAVVQQINSAVEQMVTLGNTQFNGQQLFGGTNSAAPPFSIDAAGNVVYSGSAEPAQSYSDLNQLFATGVTGAQAFGAISQPVEGASLTPAITGNTPLSTLNGGKGVAAGSIAISDGQNTATVNLSGAQTLGDVATLIEQDFDQAVPQGESIAVAVAPTGLTLQLVSAPAGANLSVQEVDGGSTASDLGILNVQGSGLNPIVGQPLTVTITPNTPLNSLFGTQAQANINFGVPNSDIILQANTPGAAFNGVNVTFNSDAPSAGQEKAFFDAATNTLTVSISTFPTSASRASQIVSVINSAGLPFTASLDPTDQNGGGQPPITTLPSDTTTSGGSGTTLDTSGLQIVSGGKTYTISLGGDTTVQDLLNSINSSGAGLDAEINSAQTGINVSSRVSGADFSIGENGGTTATQLGLRTFNANTQLSQLNYGAGVGVNTVTAGGTDFTISETINGAVVQVPVSIAGDTTIGGTGINNVLYSINTAAKKFGATFTAQLATTGNGIELTDSNPAAGPIVVTASTQSTAAVDLGLVPKGQTSATSAATAALATGTEALPSNSELLFQAVDPATADGVQVSFQANPNIAPVQYNPVAKTLTFQIFPQTTANDIITALQNNPAASNAFTASLDTSSTSRDPNNNGNGIVQPELVTMANGTAAFGSNSELRFQAVNPGAAGNVTVSFQYNPNITAGNETVQYDPTANTLTFQVSSQTTANDIIAALKNNPTASAAFTASLDTSRDPNNNGNGIVQQPQSFATTGGEEEVLTGSDTNPQQTDSVFNALLKLGTAIQNNDNPAIQQAMTLLSNSIQNLNNAHDALGVQEQALSTTNTQLSDQQINLQSAMSTDYDTNMANAIADYTTEQIAYQATLETTASIMKMTLLSYL